MIPSEKQEVLEAIGRSESRVMARIDKVETDLLKKVEELELDSADAIKLADGFDTVSRILTFVCTILVGLAAIWEFTR